MTTLDLYNFIFCVTVNGVNVLDISNNQEFNKYVFKYCSVSNTSSTYFIFLDSEWNLLFVFFYLHKIFRTRKSSSKVTFREFFQYEIFYKYFFRSVKICLSR